MDPNAEGSLYCAEQIKIPPLLPDILKEFTKAAIRTQPPDLLRWSAAYFEALNRNEVPPVKNRLEQSLISTDARLGGFSKGVLSVLHKQLGSENKVALSLVRDKWVKAGCHLAKLDEIIRIGDFSGEEVEWKKLLAVCCTMLEKTLPAALKVLCEILTTDPEGGAERIELGLFKELYSFLASVDGEISKKQVAEVINFLTDESHRYNGRVGPREFSHQLCPPLDRKSSS